MIRHTISYFAEVIFFLKTYQKAWYFAININYLIQNVCQVLSNVVVYLGAKEMRGQTGQRHEAFGASEALAQCLNPSELLFIFQ